MADGAFGAIWRIDISSTMTVVPGLEDMEMPYKKNHKVETTNHGSSGGYQEYFYTGFKEQPTVKMKLQWDASNTVHKQLNTLDQTPALTDMEFESAAGEVISVPCIVEVIKRMNPLKGIVQAEVEIQPSGAPTIVMPS